MQSTIQAIGEELGITIILVSHDPSDTLSWVDEIMVMKDGQVIQSGSPLIIYRTPVDAYVAGLFGKYTLLNKTQLTSLSIVESDSPVFLRPEDFILTNENSKSVTGEVKRVLFLGSHYEIETVVSGELITLRAIENNVAEGDIVHVSVSPAYIARYNQTTQ